jgi:hypothetical protein
MKVKRDVLLLLANGGMELSWLYALVNFITIAMIHRPFPLPEALGTFALAAALTLIARGSGWRVILILGIQVVGFVCAASRIVYVFDSWSFPFLSQGWLLEFFGRPRGFVEWFIFAVLLFFALSFWLGGLALARRPGAYIKICARFDLGVAAFACLFLVKFLFLIKGNMDIHDRAAELLLFPFFLFSLLAIGMARNRSMARRDFLAGYQGIGIFLSFTVVVLVFAAGLVLLFLPYLTMAAEFGYGILKTTARPLGPILVSILRFLFMHGVRRPETSSQSGGGDEVDIVSSTETSWWMELLEKVLGWGFVGLAALIGIIACCLGAWYLLRWLFSRTSRSEEKHIQWNLIFLWASRLWTGLIVLWHKLVARLKGFKDAAQLYSALLRWGRHSGLPRSLSETPAEYGGRLERQFPPLRRNIEVIVDAYNEQVYGEMVLDESRLTTAKHSWRSLRSPYYWPSRVKSWFLRSGEY